MKLQELLDEINQTADRLGNELSAAILRTSTVSNGDIAKIVARAERLRNFRIDLVAAWRNIE